MANTHTKKETVSNKANADLEPTQLSKLVAITENFLGIQNKKYIHITKGPKF